MSEQQEKGCKNCRYYMAHYVISGVRYYETNDGHCVNGALIQRRIAKRERDRYRLQDGCEFWEPVEIKKAERRETIKETLRGMQKSLAEIAMILKEDEN